MCGQSIIVLLSLLMQLAFGCYESDTTFRGLEKGVRFFETPYECHSWCAETDGCDHWEWTTVMFNGLQKFCFLKTGDKQERGPGKFKDGVITGPKHCPTQTCRLRNIMYLTWPANIIEIKRTDNADDCWQLCEANPFCKFWSWQPESQIGVLRRNKCKLRREHGTVIPMDGAISGPKDCAE